MLNTSLAEAVQEKVPIATGKQRLSGEQSEGRCPTEPFSCPRSKDKKMLMYVCVFTSAHVWTETRAGRQMARLNGWCFTSGVMPGLKPVPKPEGSERDGDSRRFLHLTKVPSEDFGVF